MMSMSHHAVPAARVAWRLPTWARVFSDTFRFAAGRERPYVDACRRRDKRPHLLNEVFQDLPKVIRHKLRQRYNSDTGWAFPGGDRDATRLAAALVMTNDHHGALPEKPDLGLLEDLTCTGRNFVNSVPCHCACAPCNEDVWGNGGTLLNIRTRWCGASRAPPPPPIQKRATSVDGGPALTRWEREWSNPDRTCPVRTWSLYRLNCPSFGAERSQRTHNEIPFTRRYIPEGCTFRFSGLQSYLVT
jgi:hypothetical protein